MDKTQNAVSFFNRNAALYQTKYMDVSAYHASLDVFCASIAKQQAEVLELACGPGNMTRYLLDKRPDLQLLATDLAPNMLEYARAANPEATFALLDCRAVLSLQRQFDAILCSFALPYLSKEEALQLIANAATALHPGGVLYLSTMEDDYSKSGNVTASTGDQVYLYYHEAGYLVQALEDNGFTLLEQRRQDFILQEGTIDLILIARKKG